MSHVSNRFPVNKKAFRVAFTTSMLIAMVSICTQQSEYHSDSLIGEVPGKSIEHDSGNEVQSIAEINSRLTAGISAEFYEAFKPLSVNAAEPKSFAIETFTVEKPVEVHHVSKKETVKVTQPVRENKLYLISDDGWESKLDVEYQDYLYQMCVKYSIPQYYELLLAQMYHESGYDVDIISKTNDYGLMQINKCNHSWLGEKLGNYDFLDPYNNIEAGVYLMSEFLNKYNDVHKALVCYNRGESAVVNGTYSTSYSYGVVDDMAKLVELR